MRSNAIVAALLLCQSYAANAEKLPWCYDKNYHASGAGAYNILRNGKSTGDFIKHRDQALAEIRERKAQDHAHYKLRWVASCTEDKAKALSSAEALRLGVTEDWSK